MLAGASAARAADTGAGRSADRSADAGGSGADGAGPAARAAALAAGLDEMGCQALLVVAGSAAEPDLAPFLAAPVHVGPALLVAAARGDPPRLAYLTPMERDEAARGGLPVLTPEELEVTRSQAEAQRPADHLAWVMERALAACAIAPGRVALAGQAPAGDLHAACSRLARAGWEWVAGNELVLALRKRKSAPELAAIRRAAAAAGEALRAVARRLAAAMPRGGELWIGGGVRATAGLLRAEVAQLFAARGLEQPRGNILAPGAAAGVPHTAGDMERVLRPGESLVVDLFPCGAPPAMAALFADCSRTFCAGAPPEALRRAHGIVLEVLAEARRGAVAGARGWDLQEAACHRFAAHGYPTPLSHPGTTSGYVHNLGHGVGFALHEQPIFRKVAGAEGVLAAGDAFTLEPGLYDPGAGFGVRLEDLHWLGPDGLELLTDLPYDLDPHAWLAAETAVRPGTPVAGY